MNGSLFFEGDDFYDALMRDLGGARRRVWMEFYIFRADRAGMRILRRLRFLSLKRGVQVRLMLDGIGSRRDIEAIRALLAGTGVDLQIYKPVSLFSLFRSGLHRRNHRKLVLIDGRVCWLGGMNVKEECSMHWYGPARWRDTMLRLDRSRETAPFFRYLGANMFLLFETVRHHIYPLTIANALKRFAPRNLKLLAVLRRRSRRYGIDGGSRSALDLHTTLFHGNRVRFRRAYLAMIEKAQHRILICTPYFVADRRLVRLLRRKAVSGVDVRILTAGTTDVWSARQAGRSNYFRLLRSGARIFEFQGRIFHAKQTLADEHYYLGSGNLDYRSFLHNQETMVLGRGPEFRLSLEARWNRDMSESHEIHIQEWRRRGIWEKLTEKVCRAFRYYL